MPQNHAAGGLEALERWSVGALEWMWHWSCHVLVEFPVIWKGGRCLSGWQAKTEVWRFAAISDLEDDS